MGSHATSQSNIGFISTPSLRTLVETGQLREVEVRAQPGGYIVLVKAGMLERVLKAQRSGARVFAKVDSAVRFLRELGIGRMTVDAADLPIVKKQRDMFAAREMRKHGP